jgi:hypothetical protein
MGVYVYKSIHINAIKIGNHCTNNAWNRIAYKGFYSCICPEEIKNKVSIHDLTLLYWYPNLTMKDEKIFHKKLHEYKICGEWFRSEAIDKFLEMVSQENKALECSKEDALLKRKKDPEWCNEEIIKLLNLIRKKKTIYEIALEHERTVESINLRLRAVATDYWFNNKLSMEEIEKYTRLTRAEIQEEIYKYASNQENHDEDTEDTILNTLDYYNRKKEPWSEKELENIKTEYFINEMNIMEIANIHRRTPGSIAFKLKSLELIRDVKKTKGYDIYLKSKLYREIISTPKVAQSKKTKVTKPLMITAEEKTINEVYNEVVELRKDIKEILKVLNSLTYPILHNS